MYEAYHVGRLLVAHALSHLGLEPMARALLVLGVGGLGTPKRTLKVRRGYECCAAVDPAGLPRRDLLDQSTDCRRGR